MKTVIGVLAGVTLLASAAVGAISYKVVQLECKTAYGVKECHLAGSSQEFFVKRNVPVRH